MKKIAVLHLITGLNTGGAEIALLRLAEKMDRDHFDMRVVCMIPLGAIGDKMLELGIQVTSLDMPPGRPTLRGLRQLLTIIKEFKPDILQTWLYHADLLGLIAAKLSGIFNLVWNIRIAELDFSQYSKLSSLTMRACALFSNSPRAVIVNSKAGQVVHTRLGYHPKKWVYIPNGIDTNRFISRPDTGEAFRREWNIAPNELVVGHVGRLSPQKDHPTLLKAAAIVHKQSPQTHFICVGEGLAPYEQELKALAASLDLKNLYWAGNRRDMVAVYNALDFLVLSSNGEGFPNVVAEAMACEKPCIVTNVGDAAYLVADSGINVPPANPQALAEAILSLSNKSQSDRIYMGGQARQRIQENFSLDKMVQAYSQLYIEIASQTTNK